MSTPLIASDSIDPQTGRKMYEVCDSCNYERHVCHACGESLSHSEHDSDGNHHTMEFCRPDLFPHEPGDTCTRPRKPELMAIPGYEPWCYFDHEGSTE